MAPEISDAVTAALREGHREFLGFVRRHTASVADAEDVLQDFYLKVVRSAWTLRSREKLGAWLAQVLRRTLADHYRGEGVRKRLEDRLNLTGELAVRIDDDAERAVCGCLYRLLPLLPRDYEQVLWRVDLLGEPRDQVARTLGVSRNTLSVRLHRARQTLRTALERFCTTCTVHGFLACACDRTREPVRGESMKRPQPRTRKR
jgi:RNA polymerase sigma factor (sigma-70 family)